MKNLHVVLIVAVVLLVGLFAVAGAQEEGDAPGILLSEDTFDVTVEISYSDGDQIVRAQVPAQLVLDATNAVSSVVGSHGSTVGIFGFDILEMLVTYEEFEYSKYGSFSEPSDGNKLVVVVVDTTNMWNETVEGYSLRAEAIDSSGNYYEHDHKSCEEMHPGETGRCLFGFEVAEDIEFTSMAVEADDHKTFALPAPSE